MIFAYVRPCRICGHDTLTLDPDSPETLCTDCQKAERERLKAEESEKEPDNARQ